MAAVKSKDTKPELAVRRALHRLGFRYRLSANDLPGRPDIVLPRFRRVVFVNGCFWHGHDCPGGSLPSSNTEYWRAKQQRNMRRDASSVAALRAGSWRVTVIWECHLADDTKRLLKALVRRRYMEQSK